MYPTNNIINTGVLNPLDLLSTMGSTTHIIVYKNLYGITLKQDEKTSLGMEIY